MSRPRPPPDQVAEFKTIACELPATVGLPLSRFTRPAPATSRSGSPGGRRELLGLWWQETEGAKFWLAVLNDLHQRGVADVLIACVDGLTGFPEAIAAIYPDTWVQTCIVPLKHTLCQLG